MRNDKILGLQFTAATPDERTHIVRDFTDRRLNPFSAQRFPHEIEQQLDKLLAQGADNADRQLLIARYEAEPVLFIICSPWKKPPVLHLAGVWPAWRGRGIFSALAEALIIQCHPAEAALVHIRYEMYIAIRQLKKHGYQDITPGNSKTFYRSDFAT